MCDTVEDKRLVFINLYFTKIHERFGCSVRFVRLCDCVNSASVVCAVSVSSVESGGGGAGNDGGATRRRPGQFGSNEGSRVSVHTLAELRGASGFSF